MSTSEGNECPDCHKDCDEGECPAFCTDCGCNKWDCVSHAYTCWVCDRSLESEELQDFCQSNYSQTGVYKDDVYDPNIDPYICIDCADSTRWWCCGCGEAKDCRNACEWCGKWCESYYGETCEGDKETCPAYCVECDAPKIGGVKRADSAEFVQPNDEDWVCPTCDVPRTNIN